MSYFSLNLTNSQWDNNLLKTKLHKLTFLGVFASIFLAKISHPCFNKIKVSSILYELIVKCKGVQLFLPFKFKSNSSFPSSLNFLLLAIIHNKHCLLALFAAICIGAQLSES